MVELSVVSDVNATLVLATKPSNGIGLITFDVSMPRFVWTELLTHKRIARNAVSARDVTLKDLYLWETFYTDATGMRRGEMASDEVQETARKEIMSLYRKAVKTQEKLKSIGVTREVYNRVLPMTAMISGYVTATQPAWEAFLALRAVGETGQLAGADYVMWLLAKKLQICYNRVEWKVDDTHYPLQRADDISLDLAIARIACKSYQSARERTDDEQIALVRSLESSKHLSPFEHFAKWKKFPRPNVLCSVFEQDMNPAGYGWENLRAEKELQWQQEI